MREGRPPALAKAPCSRERSWRIGWTLRTSPPAEISTVLADDRDLHLAADVSSPDAVVRPGEATRCPTSRPCGSRHWPTVAWRGRGRLRLHLAGQRRLLLGRPVPLGVGGDEHPTVVDADEPVGDGHLDGLTVEPHPDRIATPRRS